tara:strand:- start:398 stop:826 length:429 start_codon:yes stop_codon:yes gene_type:complete
MVNKKQKIKTRYASELNMYILKESEVNYSDKFNSTYNGSGNFSKYYGYKDFANVKIKMEDVLSFINLLFSYKFNIVTQKEEFRKELKMSRNKFLEISVNLNKHVREHNLISHLKFLRSQKRTKKINLSMSSNNKTTKEEINE